MPTKLMCAACAARECDRTAILLKLCGTSEDFAQSVEEPLPGRFCEPAAWVQVFDGLRTRGPEYIGGEVRPAVFAEIDAEANAETLPI